MPTFRADLKEGIFLYLESIRLINYACFKEITVEFTSGFNVVAGVNGIGKTSLLEAIGEYLLFYRNMLLPTLNNVRVEMQIHENQYRFERQYPVVMEVTAKLSLEGKLSCSIFKKLNDVQLSTSEGDHVSRRNNETQLNEEMILPLLAFYRAGRNWTTSSGKRSDIQAIQHKVSRKDAYNDWQNAAANVNALTDWVLVKTMERLQTFAETGLPPNDTDNANDELSLINRAIAIAIEEAKGLRYDIKQKNVLMEWKPESGKPIALFDSLSDGQRAVAALVADIARRACILNPQLGTDVLSKTPGVVLIDELDLHLHPQWQRHLPNGLKKAFPEMQFITTTHSPQVLSELAPNEILLLGEESAEHPEASYGLNSDRVLEDIMDTASRPQGIRDELLNLFAAIERGELDEAKRLAGELSSRVPYIPEIASARALIKRKEIIGR
ncbi:MAG: AAA family ATPase [Synergistaceae bacterium]|jgi:predicted ATP-binding protein involved in virulence|nr:AAA family ATPase [Synergistaceae bacterium]